MSHENAPDRTLTVSLDGYTDLPPGKLANLVTYLEMRTPPLRQNIDRPDLRIAPLGPHLDAYRTLFRRVGERWLWNGRLRLDVAALTRALGHEELVVLALCRGDDQIGLLELDFATAGECELVYFGVVPEAIGSGAGRFLMNEAISRAFARPIERLFVHTCTFDHPGAVDFYKRSGFTPYKLAIEIHDDPRLTGALPREAAPHVPRLG